MIFNHPDPPLETPEEESPDLEITIELEIPIFEPEMTPIDEMLPERYIFQDDYLQKELEVEEQQEQEDLAKLLQPRIP